VRQTCAHESWDAVIGAILDHDKQLVNAVAANGSDDPKLAEVSPDCIGWR